MHRACVVGNSLEPTRNSTPSRSPRSLDGAGRRRLGSRSLLATLSAIRVSAIRTFSLAFTYQIASGSGARPRPSPAPERRTEVRVRRLVSAYEMRRSQVPSGDSAEFFLPFVAVGDSSDDGVRTDVSSAST